jgi:hypothetical protein
MQKTLYKHSFQKLYCLQCRATTLHRPIHVPIKRKDTNVTAAMQTFHRCVQCGRTVNNRGEIRPKAKLPKQFETWVFRGKENLKCTLTTNTTTANKGE